MEIQATLIDYQKVYKSIEGLSDFEKDKVIKDGLRSATAIFIKAGRSNLRSRLKGSKGTNNLMNSFRNKLKRNKLGALAGFNGFGAHAHLVDLGTVDRYTKSGAYRGKNTGNKFWTDAIEQNQTKAIDAVYSGIERSINKIILRS